jgi:hypothetical protein
MGGLMRPLAAVHVVDIIDVIDVIIVVIVAVVVVDIDITAVPAAAITPAATPGGA